MKDSTQKGFSNIITIVIVSAVVVAAGYILVNTKINVAPKDSPTPLTTLGTSPTPSPSQITYRTGLYGKVLTGPTCPVQRIDDPACDDKPYQGEFIVKIPDGVSADEFARFSTNTRGEYSIKLPPGDYIIESATRVGIRTQSQYVSVGPDGMKEFNFTLDTGIR